MNRPLLGLVLRRHRLSLVLCGLMPLALGLVAGLLYPTFARERAIATAFKSQFRLVGDQMDLLTPAGAFTLGFQHPLILLVLALAPAIPATALPAGERGRGGLDLLLATALPRRALVGTVLLVVGATAVWLAAMGLAGALGGSLLAEVAGQVPWGGLGVVACNAAALAVVSGTGATLASVLARDRAGAALVHGSVVGACLVVEITARLWRSGEWLRWCTPFGLLRPASVVGDGGSLGFGLRDTGVLLLIAAATAVLALVCEDRRRRA